VLEALLPEPAPLAGRRERKALKAVQAIWSRRVRPGWIYRSSGSCVRIKAWSQ